MIDEFRINAMKGATNYDDEDSLKNPVNQVIAVLPPERDARELIKTLHEAGLPDDAIGVLSGCTDVHKLDDAAGKKGWLAQFAQIGPNLGDLDAHHLTSDAKALQEGRTVIAVAAMEGEKRRQIAELLKRFGATYINSYGMFSIEGLG
jgi:hypothetical protein